MLTKQFLAGCFRPQHPNHSLTTKEDAPRLIRKTTTSLRSEVDIHISQGELNGPYSEVIKGIHRDTVTSTIATFKPNIVLGGYPPPVAPEEKALPRTTRATLAQLRSGWCRMLNHYMSRLDGSISDACPDCGSSPHDTSHLFNCPAKPTLLTPRELWTRPVDAARFLGLEMGTDHT